MPAKDLYHETVKIALIKDGWSITHDPFFIKYDDLRLFADLGAEKFLLINQESRKIVVEIKVLGGVSTVAEFEKALGQFNLYRDILEEIDFERSLFLAVSDTIFARFFERPAISLVVKKQRLNLIIFNVEDEEIRKWIDWQNIAK